MATTAPKKEAAATVTTPAAQSKAAIAREIFDEMQPTGVPRKEIVGRFVKEANLTEKGAATYFQNFRREAGLVVARVQQAGSTSGAAPTAGRSNAADRSAK